VDFNSFMDMELARTNGRHQKLFQNAFPLNLEHAHLHLIKARSLSFNLQSILRRMQK